MELIKEGKPITPTNPSKVIEENGATKTTVNPNFSGNKANGSANLENSVGGVEVQRGTIATPTDGSQVEHVVIKKKPKCKCCVIQ